MWRFMGLTFAFLAFAFYEMSGGSDYAPVSNSLQARAADRSAEPEPVMVAQIEPTEAEKDAPEVTRAASSLASLATTQLDDQRFEITLATADADYVPTVTAEPVDANAAAAAIDAAVQAVIEEETRAQPIFSLETYAQASAQGLISRPAASGDIRQVTGNVVNMRAGPGTDYGTVGQLREGDEIAVIDEPGNGWIMLEVVATGETGWMADWLVTASN